MGVASQRLVPAAIVLAGHDEVEDTIGEAPESSIPVESVDGGAVLEVAGVGP